MANVCWWWSTPRGTFALIVDSGRASVRRTDIAGGKARLVNDEGALVHLWRDRESLRERLEATRQAVAIYADQVGYPDDPHFADLYCAVFDDAPSDPKAAFDAAEQRGRESVEAELRRLLNRAKNEAGWELSDKLGAGRPERESGRGEGDTPTIYGSAHRLFSQSRHRMAPLDEPIKREDGE